MPGPKDSARDNRPSCHVCGQAFAKSRMRPRLTLRRGMSRLIATAAPGWQDGKRAENDCRVRLKSDLRIRQLHEKIDHPLVHRWERLAELQQIKVERLDEGADGRR